MEEFDGLGDRSNALLTWYFVSALCCIALQYTVSSVPFREIVRRFGPFRSVPFREIVRPAALHALALIWIGRVLPSVLVTSYGHGEGVISVSRRVSKKHSLPAMALFIRSEGHSPLIPLL